MTRGVGGGVPGGGVGDCVNAEAVRMMEEVLVEVFMMGVLVVAVVEVIKHD